MHGPTCIFRANLTPSSHKAADATEATKAAFFAASLSAKKEAKAPAAASPALKRSVD
jgi:hypothetical protein